MGAPASAARHRRPGRVHVSELARRLGISRPLLYMHLDKLEKARMVTGQLELSEDGKAMKYYQLVPFEVRPPADTLAPAKEVLARPGSLGTRITNGSRRRNALAHEGSAHGRGTTNTTHAPPSL